MPAARLLPATIVAPGSVVAAPAIGADAAAYGRVPAGASRSITRPSARRSGDRPETASGTGSRVNPLSACAVVAVPVATSRLRIVDVNATRFAPGVVDPASSSAYISPAGVMPATRLGPSERP